MSRYGIWVEPDGLFYRIGGWMSDTLPKKHWRDPPQEQTLVFNTVAEAQSHIDLMLAQPRSKYPAWYFKLYSIRSYPNREVLDEPS